MCLVTLVAVLTLFPQRTFAQSSSPAKKLPSAEKVVDNYFKAVGGKKKLIAIRDSTSEWLIQLNDQPIGKAKIQLKAPSSKRSEMKFGNGQILSGTTAGSAWVQGLDNRLLTLTGAGPSRLWTPGS